MWIMSQNKRIMLNSKKTIDIFITKSGKEIEAKYAEEMYHTVQLATYNSLDDSLKAMDLFCMAISNNDRTFKFPLGGEM